jgi:hypothetical protein
MSIENPLWGAPRIHGELLKLGFEVAQSTAAKYMAKRHGPPSQGWRTFLRNHAPDIAAIDLFVVPTIDFRLLKLYDSHELVRPVKLFWVLHAGQGCRQTPDPARAPAGRLADRAAPSTVHGQRGRDLGGPRHRRSAG